MAPKFTTTRHLLKILRMMSDHPEANKVGQLPDHYFIQRDFNGDESAFLDAKRRIESQRRAAMTSLPHPNAEQIAQELRVLADRIAAGEHTPEVDETETTSVTDFVVYAGQMSG